MEMNMKEEMLENKKELELMAEIERLLEKFKKETGKKEDVERELRDKLKIYRQIAGKEAAAVYYDELQKIKEKSNNN
jgi:hypothetical protein